MMQNTTKKITTTWQRNVFTRRCVICIKCGDYVKNTLIFAPLTKYYERFHFEFWNSGKVNKNLMKIELILSDKLARKYGLMYFSKWLSLAKLKRIFSCAVNHKGLALVVEN